MGLLGVAMRAAVIGVAGKIGEKRRKLHSATHAQRLFGQGFDQMLGCIFLGVTETERQSLDLQRNFTTATERKNRSGAQPQICQRKRIVSRKREVLYLQKETDLLGSYTCLFFIHFQLFLFNSLALSCKSALSQ